MIDPLDRPELDTWLAWALLQQGRLDRATTQALLDEARRGRGAGPTLARSLVARRVLPREEVEGLLAHVAATEATRAAAPAPPPARARRLGDYELLDELGSGGMGTVFRARHLQTGALYAVKLLSLSDAEAAVRFQREGEGQARVDHHPNVVRIHTLGSAGGVAYLVMDLAPEGSLEDRLREGLPAPGEVAAWVRDLARAIEHAHRRGVLHRDLKPQNVLFQGGVPKLVDFGLAKLLDARSLTETGTILGTPAYMAPEQVDARRGDVGPAADVYGLGALLYRCLTGRPPFQGGAVMKTLLRVLEEAPVPPREIRAEVPPALEAVCLRALAKDPARRQASAAALADELEAALRAPARGDGRRLAALLLGGAAVVGALTAGALLERPFAAEALAPGAGSVSAGPTPASPPERTPAPRPGGATAGPPTAPGPQWSRPTPPRFKARYEAARETLRRRGPEPVRTALEELAAAEPCDEHPDVFRHAGQAYATGTGREPLRATELLTRSALAGDAEGAAILGALLLDVAPPGQAFTDVRMLVDTWEIVRPESDPRGLGVACLVLAQAYGRDEDEGRTVDQAQRLLDVVEPGPGPRPSPAQAYHLVWRRRAELGVVSEAVLRAPTAPGPEWSRPPSAEFRRRFDWATDGLASDAARRGLEHLAVEPPCAKHGDVFRALAEAYARQEPREPARATELLARGALVGHPESAAFLGLFLLRLKPAELDLIGASFVLEEWEVATPEGADERLAVACLVLATHGWVVGSGSPTLDQAVDLLRRIAPDPSDRPSRDLAYQLLWRRCGGLGFDPAEPPAPSGPRWEWRRDAPPELAAAYEEAARVQGTEDSEAARPLFEALAASEPCRLQAQVLRRLAHLYATAAEPQPEKAAELLARAVLAGDREGAALLAAFLLRTPPEDLDALAALGSLSDWHVTTPPPDDELAAACLVLAVEGGSGEASITLIQAGTVLRQLIPDEEERPSRAEAYRLLWRRRGAFGVRN